MKNLNIKHIFLMIVLCGLSNFALAYDNAALYIFGDSLSDTGNVFLQTQAAGNEVTIPPTTRYYEGRFSNGPNAADFLWENIGNGTPVIPITSFIQDQMKVDVRKWQAVGFAFGGSETGFYTSVLGQFYVPGLLGQATMFGLMKTGGSVSNNVALVWSGGNDYLNQFAKEQLLSTSSVVKNIKNAIKMLYLAGIRSFIVPNLPDLSQTPIAYIMADIYQNPRILTTLNRQTIEHNNKLRSALQELNGLPKIKIRHVDIYSVAQGLIGPELVFPGPAAGCLYNQPAPTAEACGDVDLNSDVIPGTNIKLIYWDETHPTTYAHEAFANAMLEAINQK